MPILVAVEDLIFLSKIQQTAKLVDVAIETVAPGALAERLGQGPASAIVCDLNGLLALDAVRWLKENRPSVPVIGFLSHVQADLATAAREAGCDVVMARSAFSQQLPRLLLHYRGDAAALTPSAPPPERPDG
jgi:DNA-binding NarL/FixJ family response regulator